MDPSPDENQNQRDEEGESPLETDEETGEWRVSKATSERSSAASSVSTSGISLEKKIDNQLVVTVVSLTTTVIKFLHT